jgi:hypothetical protein
MTEYVIWSFEHAMWWGPARRGYTPDIEKAGRYGATDAGDIVTDSVMLDEVAVIEPLAVRRGQPRFHPYDGERP